MRRPAEAEMEGRACRERDTFGYLRRYTLGLGLLWTLVIAALTVYSFLSFRQRALGDAAFFSFSANSPFFLF
jgi:hypothetical protein